MQDYSQVFLPQSEQEPAAEAAPSARESRAPAGPGEAVVVQTPAPVPAPRRSIPLSNSTDASSVARCPRCGASQTDMVGAALMRCAFCRHEWQPERVDEAWGLSEGISELRGTVRAPGAADRESDEDLVTLRCDGCGAEVMIDTSQTLRATCHWCRHELTLRSQVPNGAVPDAMLPFTVTKAQAWAGVQAEARRRWWFASKGFRTGLTPEHLKRVYLPYMSVDVRANVRMDGVGEIETGRSSHGDHTRYEARRYAVMRQVEIDVDDLLVEASSGTADTSSETATTNILGAILPFDVKNAVRFDARLLEDDATVQRRDLDPSEAGPAAVGHVMAIARESARESIAQYDRYVQWGAEQARIDGSRWVSMLLPVWLYSHVERHRGKETIHYVAVNGRTGATASSVPMDRRRTAAVALAPGLAIAAPFLVPMLFYLTAGWDRDIVLFTLALLAFLTPFVAGPAALVWFIIKRRYRNAGARYEPEKVVARRSVVVADSDLALGDVTSFSAGVPWPNSTFGHLRARHSVYFARSATSGPRLGPPPIATDVPYETDSTGTGLSGISAQLGSPRYPRLVTEPPAPRK